MVIQQQRLDETAMPNGTAVTLHDGTEPETWIQQTPPEKIALFLGLDVTASELLSWDVFQGVLSPLDLIVLASWRSADAAGHQHAHTDPVHATRARSVRVIRDYGKYHRTEAPQYYPAAAPN